MQRVGVFLLASIVLTGTTAVPKRDAVLLVGASHTVAYSAQFPCKAGTLARGGHQTRWMREHLASALVGGQYHTIAVLGGINDVLSDVPLEQTVENLEAMARIAKDYNVDIKYLTLPSFGGYENPELPQSRWTPHKQERIDAINRWIRRTRPHGHIDAARLLSGRRQSLKPQYRGGGSDGYLHPNKEGYAAMAGYVAKELGCAASRPLAITGHPQ